MNLHIMGATSGCYPILLRIFDYEEIKGEKIKLNEEFIKAVKTTISSKKSVKYFPMKLPNPKLGFSLCSADSCDDYLLVNGAVLNLTKGIVWYLEISETDVLQELLHLSCQNDEP